MKSIKIQLPMTREVARSLRAGDAVLLSGDLYTARDAAHKRLIAALDAGKPLPINLENELIYYVGPAPASPGRAVGPAVLSRPGKLRHKRRAAHAQPEPERDGNEQNRPHDAGRRDGHHALALAQPAQPGNARATNPQGRPCGGLILPEISVPGRRDDARSLLDHGVDDPACRHRGGSTGGWCIVPWESGRGRSCTGHTEGASMPARGGADPGWGAWV